MKKLIYSLLAFAISAALFSSCEKAVSGKQQKHRSLIVFFDGLRPDYITEEYMPNLFALRNEGSYGNQHHSVFPTVTRVNSPSYATGSYPGTHGLMGNSVFFSEVDKTKDLNTGDASELMKVAEAENGDLLTSVSLGEVLLAKEEKLMVFSSGSTGQAYLQNHKLNGGAIVNPDLILPEEFREELVSVLGSIPERSKPNTARHKWVTDALLKFGFAKDGPLVNAIWFSDPDGTAHAEGIGAPLAMESIKAVDYELGRILDHLKKNGLYESFNILISTDHGFSTHIGKESLTDLLINEGFKSEEKPEEIVVAGGAIYVTNKDDEIIKSIVAVLQKQEWVGAIFTRPSESDRMLGFVDGTLSFETIHWNHLDRRADILVDVNWNDRKNEYGYAGHTYSRGVAGHGSSSPFDVHIPLVLAGPDFKKAYKSDLPTSNVDLIPTLLHTYGYEVPEEMDGRVIKEMLEKEVVAENKETTKKTIETSVSFEWGTYQLILEQSEYDDHRYADYTKVSRMFSAADVKAQ